MHEGFKSSEFYMALLAALLGVVKTFFVPDLPMESILAMGAYIVGRSAVKVAKATQGAMKV